MRQRFPENEFRSGFSAGTFAAVAVGVGVAGTCGAAANVREEYQADGDHHEQDEQPYVLIP